MRCTSDTLQYHSISGRCTEWITGCCAESRTSIRQICQVSHLIWTLIPNQYNWSVRGSWIRMILITLCWSHIVWQHRDLVVLAAQVVRTHRHQLEGWCGNSKVWSPREHCDRSWSHWNIHEFIIHECISHSIVADRLFFLMYHQYCHDAYKKYSNCLDTIILFAVIYFRRIILFSGLLKSQTEAYNIDGYSPVACDVFVYIFMIWFINWQSWWSTRCIVISFLARYISTHQLNFVACKYLNIEQVQDLSFPFFCGKSSCFW